MKKILFILLCISFIILLFVLIILYLLNVIEHKSYSNLDFNISSYLSSIDKDNDGIDDQTDILDNAKEYIKTKPKYESKYYSTGYPNDEYGVCTDVVGIALLNSGYNLMELVNQDIINNKKEYNIDIIDKNIDFRRVRNLDIYFKHTAISLSTDIKEIDKWQGGDIIVFKDHIGIISDKRNKYGTPFIIHHANPYQIRYEEDILKYYNNIIGHYRIS